MVDRAAVLRTSDGFVDITTKITQKILSENGDGRSYLETTLETEIIPSLVDLIDMQTTIVKELFEKKLNPYLHRTDLSLCTKIESYQSQIGALKQIPRSEYVKQSERVKLAVQELNGSDGPRA